MELAIHHLYDLKFTSYLYIVAHPLCAVALGSEHHVYDLPFTVKQQQLSQYRAKATRQYNLQSLPTQHRHL
jgi:hypothetical protein